MLSPPEHEKVTNIETNTNRCQREGPEKFVGYRIRMGKNGAETFSAISFEEGRRKNGEGCP